MINLKAYAKLNLFLNITGKLDNGYHSTVIAVRKHLLFIVGEAGNNCFGDIETFPVIDVYKRQGKNTNYL